MHYSTRFGHESIRASFVADRTRARVLENYLPYYNTERQHTAIGGLTPFQMLVKKSIPGL